MKKNLTREILLMSNTSFARQQLHEMNSEEKHQLSPLQELEEACWNGLITEILPDVVDKSMAGKILFLWHVCPGDFLIQLQLSEFPLELEKHYSINPNTYISVCNGN